MWTLCNCTLNQSTTSHFTTTSLILSLCITEAEEAFVEEFLDACAAGDLSNTQEAISSGRLTVEDLDEGLKLATEEARPEIVTALFDAGARATSAISWLTGEQRELPGIIRQFFDHGLDPNATSNGEPLLW